MALQLSQTNQYMIVLALIVAGIVILLKGGKWWGLLPIAGAVYWLLQMLQTY